MNASEWFRKAEQFVRSSTAGLDGGELQRLFDCDAPRAYGVVTREHDRGDEPLYDDCSLVVLRREAASG
jgi:hypothetical protein